MRNRRGPATVMGERIFLMPLSSREDGKAEDERRGSASKPLSQETCLEPKTGLSVEGERLQCVKRIQVERATAVP